MEFKIGKDGYRTISNIADNEVVLADFLTSEVQSSYDYIEILEALDSRNHIKNYLWEVTGNAHTITITNENINIFNEFNEDSVTITDFEYFKNILLRWQNLISERN